MNTLVSRKIKIAILVNDLLRGGVQRIIFDLAHTIDRNRYDVLVVYFKRSGAVAKAGTITLESSFEEIGTNTVCLEGSRRWSFSEFGKLIRVLRTFNPDIVHTFLPYAGIVGRVIAFMLGYRNIVSTLCNLPVSVKRSVWILDQITFVLARVHIAAAEGIAQYYFKAVTLFTQKRWEAGLRKFTIVAGVHVPLIRERAGSVNKLQLRTQLQIPENIIIVTMIARLVSWKGHRDFIKAISLLPVTFQGIIVGWGNIESELKAYAKELEVSERVHFLGSRNDTYEILGVSDIYAQTYRNQSKKTWMGPNTSQMEACAAGVPSVSTDIPLVEYLIKDKVSGLIAKRDDPQDIAEKILWLYEHPIEAQQMALEARQIVLGRYSTEQMCRAYEHVYEAMFR